VVVSVEPQTTIFRPSADVMMVSAAEVFAEPLLGVIMTGMGKDGLQGLKKIKEKGGYVLAQDEQSCVVYGMPKVAVEEGVADEILPLAQIPDALIQIAGLHKGSKAGRAAHNELILNQEKRILL
ncbi:MAG TPA: hypothetical protein DCP63_11540, partial [Bacteroidetes bacterium]|nr:hypothetical protein [Bacteroidota bacterium]